MNIAEYGTTKTLSRQSFVSRNIYICMYVRRSSSPWPSLSPYLSSFLAMKKHLSGLSWTARFSRVYRLHEDRIPSMSSPVGYAFGIVPYILRGVRIVVLYHSSYRYKYAGFVKWRNLRKAWAATSLSIGVLAAILFTASARHYRWDVK